MEYWMWSRKEHKSKTKENKNLEKLLSFSCLSIGHLTLRKGTTRAVFFHFQCPQYLSPGKYAILWREAYKGTCTTWWSCNRKNADMFCKSAKWLQRLTASSNFALLDILHNCLCLAAILCTPIELCSISWMFSTLLVAMAEVYLKEGDNAYSKGETNNAVHFYSEGLQVNCKDIKLNAELYSKRAAVQLLLGKNLSIVLDQFCIHFDRDLLQSFTVWIVCAKEKFCCLPIKVIQEGSTDMTRTGSMHGSVISITRFGRFSIRPLVNWKMG